MRTTKDKGAWALYRAGSGGGAEVDGTADSEQASGTTMCKSAVTRVAVDAPELLHLPFVGLRMTGRILDVPHGTTRLMLTWRAIFAAGVLRRGELDLQVVDGDDVRFAIEFCDDALTHSRFEVALEVFDAERKALARSAADVRAVSVADLPIRDTAVLLPLRGMRLRDLEERRPGERIKADGGNTSDMRVVMREASALPLGQPPSEDLQRMTAAGGLAKRFVRSSYPLPELWVAELEHATVFGDSGVVVGRDGIAGESWLSEHPRIPPYMQARPFLKGWPSEPVACGDVAIWWAGAWQKPQYYHTHAEAMAALIQLEIFRDLAGGSDFEILLPRLSGWPAEAIELLGLDTSRLRPVGDDILRPSRLFWPSAAIRQNLVIEPLLRLYFRRIRAAVRMRAATGGIALPDGAEPAQAVYIARLDSPIRRMRNEAELIERLRGLGVTIFVAQGLSYAQQVLALSRARVVIGPHGAGLTNMGFAPRGAMLAELHPASFVSPLYFRLTQLLDQRYRAFTAPVAQGASDSEPGAWSLDIAAFLDWLDPILAAEALA